MYLHVHVPVADTCTCTCARVIKNHNSLGCERPSGLDVEQSPNAQNTFRPIPGLISCAGVTGSVGITRTCTSAMGIARVLMKYVVVTGHMET